MKDNALLLLLLFFKASTAIMDFGFRQTGVKTEMHILHEAMILELESDAPQKDKIDYLLLEMQNLAGANHVKETATMPKLKPGGTVPDNSDNRAVLDGGEYIIKKAI